MIGIVDYGIGNLQAFMRIFGHLGRDARLVQTPSELDHVNKLILPGVGSFDWAMQKLESSGMRQRLDELVLGRQVDVLGICVGMQIMAKSSQEGILPGLGWIDAEVVKFNEKPRTKLERIPHMGWNDVSFDEGCPLFRGLQNPKFYFLHSYFIKARQKDLVVATANHGVEFGVAVKRDNIFGTQFHPEKSHDWGVNLLNNFAELPRC